MMHKQAKFFRITATAIFAAALSISCAHAQDAAPPSESQLASPAGAQAPTLAPSLAPTSVQNGTTPAAVPQAPATATTQQSASNEMPTQPQTVKNAAPASNDPCPTPEDTASKAPDDMAKVQEDINRLTLCAQRAQLLEHLNDSVIKNQEADDQAMGLKAPGIAGMQRAGGAGLPPLPANALAGADVSPLPAGIPAKPKSAAPAAAETGGSDAAADKAAETAKAEPAKAANPWTIREIYSAGGSVVAKLISPEGDEVRAKDGMKLPDGKTTIVRVTPAGVTVKDDKGMKPLDWTKS